MKFESKFEIGDIVYVKSEKQGVFKAKIVGINLVTKYENSKDASYKFIYDLWVSDRLDWAGHSDKAFECNIAYTFDDAYYNSSSKFPWDIKADHKIKKLK